MSKVLGTLKTTFECELVLELKMIKVLESKMFLVVFRQGVVLIGNTTKVFNEKTPLVFNFLTAKYEGN